MHVDGEIINTGALHNNGIISFTGNWTNTGKYKGEGTVEARGHAPQKIAHSGQYFNRLSLNGWGTKFLSGKLVIGDELNLQKGIIEVSHDDALKMDAKAVVKAGHR